MPLKSSPWNHILKTDDFFFSFNELKEYKLKGSLQNFQDSVGKHQNQNNNNNEITLYMIH